MSKPAFFFDRDGVLNKDIGYLYRAEDFQWMPGAVEAIRYLNAQGYYVFVVTNQSGVARGYYTEKDVQDLHKWMDDDLEKQGAYIDAYCYCPHHPEGIIKRYCLTCDCRKPQAGMINGLLAQYAIDQRHSFMIGDRISDMECAKSAGISGYLYDGENLLEFIKKLI